MFRKRHLPVVKASQFCLTEMLERRLMLHGFLDVADDHHHDPTVYVTAPLKPASENGPTARPFTIWRAGDLSDPLVVRFMIGGTATNGVDYGIIGNAITVPSGSDHFRIWVRPVDDDIPEFTETVTLTLQPSDHYVIGDPAAATIRILDNDTVKHELPTVSVHAPALPASEEGPTPRPFTIKRDGDTSHPLVVHLHVGGTATNGVDYGVIGDAITIPAGHSTFRLWVRPIDDDLVEGTETVVLSIVPSAHYDVGQGSATIYILDNDMALPVVSVTAPAAPASEEGPTPRPFTIHRDGDTSHPLVVHLHVGGTATNGVDYGVIGDAITIPAGHSTFRLWVRPIDDDLVEGTETVELSIVPSPKYALRASSSATILILDNDVHAPPPEIVLPTVNITADSLPASESGPTSRNFNITRSGPTDDPLVVHLSISGTATNGVDYHAIDNTVTIPAGHSSVIITVMPIDDDIVEDTETVMLTIVANASYEIGSHASATISILDNDTHSSPTTITWTSQAASPIPRAEALRAVVDGKLYVFGGFSGDLGPVLRSDVYDPATNTWTRIADLPKRITHAGTAVDGRHVYIAGGYVGIGSVGYSQTFGTREVWRFDVDTQQWMAMPLLPTAVASGGLAVIGRKLHYFGGNNSSRQDIGHHYALDLDNPSAGWTTLASLPNGRSHFGYVALNNRVYVIGGQFGNDEALTTVKLVHMWDPNNPSTWTRLADLPIAVGHISSSTFVMGHRIIVAGGETAHNAATNKVFAFTPGTNSWAAMSNLPAPRFSGVAAEIDGDIYFTTGSSMTNTWKGVLS